MSLTWGGEPNRTRAELVRELVLISGLSVAFWLAVALVWAVS